MEKETKWQRHASTLSVLALALIVAGYAVAIGGPGTDSASAPAGNATLGTVSFKNFVTVEVIHADGTREPTQMTWNTVTDEGLNYTRDFLAGFNSSRTSANGFANWTVIELSTDTNTPSVTNSTCASVVTGNGLDIAQATTVVKQNRGNMTASKTFAVTGTQTSIIKVCLSNNTATGNSDLMASALISSTNVASGDTLIVNYSVAVQ